MVWKFYKSIFLTVVEMKEIVGFNMAKNSCGLTKAAHLALREK